MGRIRETNQPHFKIRFADEADVPLILTFVKELAQYEEMSDQVTATIEGMQEVLFERKMAEVVFAEYEGTPVGFMLFFHNFSTFLGKPGIYIEDLYIRPAMRGKGLGKILLSFLAQLALERGCGRLEWACLDWNEPSIEFYKKRGAIPLDEWTVYRVEKQALLDLAGQKKTSESSKDV